jgi:hypothetical protein
MFDLEPRNALQWALFALGVMANFAYAPGEVKVMTFSDAADFEEVQRWQSSSWRELNIC